jgi:hypothetical protein
MLATIIAASMLAGTAVAAPTHRTSSRIKESTLTLDDFALSPTVQYSTDGFWCSFNDYGAYFANYTGQCPYQDYVASLHWKKVQDATEYDVCLESVFQSFTPGFACWVMPAMKAGNPASLSMTFDSAAMLLNSFQGATQVWMVKACAFDPVTHTGPCTESNTVEVVIPWTG